MATVRVVLGIGALHLTEFTLALFNEDCTLAWKRDEDFAGWTFEGVTPNEVHLLAGDWMGAEWRQRTAVIDGARLE